MLILCTINYDSYNGYSYKNYESAVMVSAERPADIEPMLDREVQRLGIKIYRLIRYLPQCNRQTW
jgi:hypothetical protein